MKTIERPVIFSTPSDGQYRELWDYIAEHPEPLASKQCERDEGVTFELFRHPSIGLFSRGSDRVGAFDETLVNPQDATIEEVMAATYKLDDEGKK